MKVSGTGPIGSSSAVARGGRSGAASGSFAPDKVAETRGAGPVAPVNSIAAIDAILTLQSVPDPTTGRARAIARAGHMLDLLEEIRLGLLEGNIPRPVLSRLVALVRSERAGFADPRLADILDDIDLRAQVELAKLSEPF